MNPSDILSIFKKNLKNEKKFVDAWIMDANNERRTRSGRYSKILTPFMQDGTTQKKLVPGALSDVGFWHMMQAEQINLNKDQFPAEEVSLSALYTFWYQQCAHAIMDSDDPAGYILNYRDFIPVCTLLTLGWSNHAMRMAEALFDRWPKQKDGNGAVAWETFGEYMPWVSIKLYKIWRNSDEECQYEPSAGQLGGFAPLLENLLHPNTRVFGDALALAADFHVEGSNADEFAPVKDHHYWFFPIELLAACRIRELRGLDVPYVAHPLFDAIPMGHLQRPLRIPQDDTLDNTLPLLAKATGKLELKV